MRTLRIPLGTAQLTQLSQAQLNRQQRNALVAGVGEHGLARLASARILIVGAGGLGAPAASYLAAAGVGTLGICDADVVDESNLARQLLYRPTDLGRSKIECATQRLSEISPELKVQTHGWLTTENISEIASQYDLILDCGDNFELSYLLDDWCAENQKPWVWAAVVAMSWQLSVFWSAPSDGGAPARLRDIYPVCPPAEQIPSSRQIGVLGSVAGEAGCAMATEAIKLICGFGATLLGKLAINDAAMANRQVVEFRSSPEENR